MNQLKYIKLSPYELLLTERSGNFGNEVRKMKKLRLVIGFVLAVLLLQGIATLFLTPEGLELVYQVPLRFHAESFKPENNTYVVYYETRVDISEADLIIVGADGNVAESYDILGHFTRFLKQYNNISSVMLDFDKVEQHIASGLMNEDTEARFYARLGTLKGSKGIPQDFLDYLSELFVVNTTMPPVRKFELASYSEELTSGVTLAERIAETFAETERSSLCVIEAAELSNGSGLKAELAELMPDKKIVYLQMLYTDSCPSAETHETISFPLESGEPEVYFVNNGDFASFYKYYNAVTGLFGTNKTMEDRLDTRYTEYFFIVSGGSEPEYMEDGEV